MFTGWHILKGTFGSSKLFGVVPLADPYMFAGFSIWLCCGVLMLLLEVSIILYSMPVVGGSRPFVAWVWPINLGSRILAIGFRKGSKGF